MQEDDLDLFQQEMSGVKPLNKNQQVTKQNAPRELTPGQLERRKAAERIHQDDLNYLSTEYVDLVEPYDEFSYKKDGVQDGVFRKLRLGKYDIEGRLDLHRKTVRESRVEVFDFIHDALQSEMRTLLIVHGIGNRSTPPAILKSYIKKWLSDIPQVLAYHTAQKQHGGFGATYVLLRKSERKKQENRDRHLNRLSGK